MSVEENKATAQRFFDEVVSQGKLEVVDQLCSPDLVDHETQPGMPDGREGVKQFFAAIREAIPDMQAEVHDMVGEDDKVVVRSTMRGTHEKEFFGIPPSGDKVEIPVIDVVRVADGRAVEHWGVTDMSALMPQPERAPPG
jgi:steroid delta-isomerase-like uncharacterized protein